MRPHTHSRRDFFARLGGAWIGASLLDRAVARAALANAQAPTSSSDFFEIRQVAPGVYAALARGSAIIECNAAIFENSRDLLVVDTHSMPSAAASLVAQLRHLTPKPVRYVVNTHFHGDHVLGNPAYRQMAPGLDIISSGETRRLIAERDPGFVKGVLDGAPKQIEDLERQRAAAKTGAERARLETDLADYSAFVRQMRNYAFELPNVTFERNLVLHDRDHELHIAFRGRGHTSGDIVVFCPQKKVIATGDLLHGFLPYVGDGYPREWPATLAGVGEFPFESVIGGHGEPQPNRNRLPEMRAYIEELTEVVERGKRQGRTVEQLQSEITVASLKTLSGAYGQYVSGQIARVGGGTLADNLKENVASMFRALEHA